MGWIKQRSSGVYDLGPKLRQEFFTDAIPDLNNIMHDVELEDGTPHFEFNGWFITPQHSLLLAVHES
jgi:hypothetical protein